MFILPSANPMVKMPMSTHVQIFLHDQNPGKFPFVCTSMDSSVHHTDCPSINSSPSAANPLKIPCNYGEKTMVNYLHENPVKSPTISTSYITPFGALYVHCLYNPSVVCVICLSLHLSMHHLYNLSVHCALCLSLHLSVHHLFRLSIPMMTNMRNSWMDSPVLSMGRETHQKLQLNSHTM